MTFRRLLGLPDQITTNLSYADFYRADLSNASLKGAKAVGAVFYQARLHNTVLTRADLRGANFFEADLRGANFSKADLKNAKFDGARLHRASFSCARNVPSAIKSELDNEGIYRKSDRFKAPKLSAKINRINVFISKPGFLDFYQQQYVSSLKSRLEAESMIPLTLERPYPQFGTTGEVQRLMTDCMGAVIFGFKQLEVRDGLWRSSTPEHKEIKHQFLATPWNQIEAGMAVMLGLPILVACQREIAGGIFDVASGEHQIYQVFVDEDWSATQFANSFADWCSDVRGRSRSSLGG
jgi:hypothetical protein